MMKWFRFYNEVLDDPKVQRLHPALFKHWVNLLCLASETGDAGDLPDEDAIAFRLRVRTSEVRRILDQLVAAGLLDVCGNGAETRILSAHNWQGRQRSSDSSAARVARHRAEKGGNVTLQDTLRKRTVDTDTERDTDTEGANAPKRARAPKYSSAFEEFWRGYPSGFGSKKVSFQRWVELGVDRDASLLAEIMAGLELWLVSERWRRGFIKAAELWLRDRLWENPPPAERPTAPPKRSGVEETTRRFVELAARRNGLVPAEETEYVDVAGGVVR